MLFKKKKNIENKNQNEKLLTEFQDTNNPYLHAKWEWNERYGSFIREKEKWQKISFFILIALIISIVGLVAVSLQSKITAFFVKTDQLGKPIVIERVDPTTKLNSSVVAYQLGEFITFVRTVTTDGKLKKYWMQVAQKYCSETASNILQEYWANNPPEKIAQMMNISVSIISIMPIKSTESWQINWTETASKNGLSVGETTWSAIVNIGIIPIKNEQDFIKNPTGLIIKSINWTRTK
ncbi:VirB8/TrbF family protein [Silvanigrella aquatica]|uniref:Bacterial virulence protein VirB8 domain-containing protein n=1 Tax=Silvanigrella aquatica TaxID=1915309 RepID=A0A1L4D513_9BACT|nr:VirB8/TrbF family protein [Silvanigrella aquatica]APJ05288.1 hypothetical protein AXG55_14800 [Silvanigrella aquatica]